MNAFDVIIIGFGKGGKTLAARSMRSIEAIGSCSMVYASSFFILLLGNIFIVMFF